LLNIDSVKAEVQDIVIWILLSSDFYTDFKKWRCKTLLKQVLSCISFF